MLDARLRGHDSGGDATAEDMRSCSRDSSELCDDVALDRREGAGNAGWFSLTHGPRATRTHAAVTTGSAEITGIPCAMVLTLIPCSPRGPGFLAPVARVMPAFRREAEIANHRELG